MKTAHKKTNVLICLLQSHSVVVALAERSVATEPFVLVYANETPVRHREDMTSDRMLQNTIVAYKKGLEKFQVENKMVPAQVYVGVGDMFSNTVYRHQVIRRTQPFRIHQKFWDELLAKDIAMVEKKIRTTYKNDHVIMGSEPMYTRVNGYEAPFNHITDVKTVEQTFVHTIIPTRVVNQIRTTLSDIFHTDIPLQLHGTLPHITRQLIHEISGAWMWVHVGEHGTSIVYVKNHEIKHTAYIPLGTYHVIQYVAKHFKTSHQSASEMIHMMYDKRIDTKNTLECARVLGSGWLPWREKISQTLAGWVKKGVHISQIVYSADNEILRVNKNIFPAEPAALWYGAHTVVFIPCESVLSQPAHSASSAYIHLVLDAIVKSINTMKS